MEGTLPPHHPGCSANTHSQLLSNYLLHQSLYPPHLSPEPAEPIIPILPARRSLARTLHGTYITVLCSVLCLPLLDGGLLEGRDPVFIYL